MNTPKCPVIANVDARPHGDPSSIRQALQAQVTHAVRWQASIESLIEKGFDRFIEVGPGRVLTGMMRKINRNVQAINVSGAGALDGEALLASTRK
jgi:[acyl-carrier-protein] S-malonyltransferase